MEAKIREVVYACPPAHAGTDGDDLRLNDSIGLAVGRGLLFLVYRLYFSYFCVMLPDYPHKLFSDQRSSFNLLMETLAMDISPSPSVPARQPDKFILAGAAPKVV